MTDLVRRALNLTKRKTFSQGEIIDVLLQQGARVNCPRCGEPLELGQKFEREHFHELALGGADAVANCFISHKGCHAIATNGTPATTAGSSKHKIAKTKRMAAGGRKRKGRKVPSRPFSKRRGNHGTLAR